jgi:hypothetical protein
MKIPINANHSRICRFEHNQCIRYRTALDHIKRLLSKKITESQVPIGKFTADGSLSSQLPSST